MGILRKFLSAFDLFTTGILCAVAVGILLPCHGVGMAFFENLTHLAITLLFFLYGVKLSRQSVVEGLLNWRLQGMVFFFTFVFFPLVIPALQPVFSPLVGVPLYMGLVYVACLPSTVQSSIAFTSVAGGNVPAAVCSASVSSLLGVFVTPFLVSLLFAGSRAEHVTADIGMDTVLMICYQILLPFALGQLVQRWLRPVVHRHQKLIRLNDQATIWLVVYTSFSNATANGYWSRLEWSQLGWLIFTCFLLLCGIHLCTYYSSKWLGFRQEDRISIVFCGSKKSLAVGAPMMMAIFGHLDNNLLLPLMIFHQVQLMTCAHLARHWRRRGISAPKA